MEPDFSGWATKAGLKCSDGRTIMKDAFAHQDNETVPLVWQHGRSGPENVLGHAILENRAEGVYAYAFFNSTTPGQNAKALVEHKDIKHLSIYANQLIERSKQVFHGMIGELSLVLSGANPGALIENISIAHGDGQYDILEDEVIIYTGLELEHENMPDPENEPENEPDDAALVHADGVTVQDVYDSMSEEQKDVVHFMVGAALEANSSSAEQSSESSTEDALNHQEGTDNMSRNVFEQNGGVVTATGPVGLDSLTHEQRQEFARNVFRDGEKLGTFKDAFLAHAGEYGITNIEVLFPDAQAIDSKPEWITRRMDWVEGVINGTRKLPFSRIKSQSADLTHEEARAKGYVKATLKKEQYFEIAARETTPKTIYKKQKLDHDDITDITEFDVVAWLWVEMRFMLREEIARAILVGDGREVDDPDKIDENKIRPIAFDDEFYTDVVSVPAAVSGQDMVESVVRARETYLGNGEPTAYMTRSVMNDMLLVKDGLNRRLYRNRSELASELEVSNIVLVPVMADVMTDDGEVLMILVNLSDYSVGSTRGGEITTFEDFDIDYNQHKYLIEGRMSGALTKHKTAQVVVRGAGTMATPAVPTFNATTGVLTVPTVTGVTYKNQATDATLAAGAQAAIASGATVSVKAVPNEDYYFPHNFDADWSFTRD